MEQYTTWRWSSHASALIGGKDSTFYYYCKRGMDLVLTVIALGFLMPLMGLIALMIKLDSPGSIFFIQERVGSRRQSRNGQAVWEVRKFNVYKFRSMVRDADDSIHRAYIKAFVEGSVEASDIPRAKFKLTNDSRVTQVGQILRRTSLDELPQLFNVLKGEMSLVGPRPVPQYEVDEYRESWHHERLATLPGITGLWQVKGRCQVSFEEMIQFDLEYINRQSLWLDLKIMFLTLPAVFSGKGAE